MEDEDWGPSFEGRLEMRVDIGGSIVIGGSVVNAGSTSRSKAWKTSKTEDRLVLGGSTLHSKKA